MGDGVKIAFFASSLVSAYWNGVATYYRGIVRALHERGHRVTFYEPDASDRQRHRDLDDPEWARVVVYPVTEEGVRRAVDDARTADVVIKASNVGVFDDFLEEAVLSLKRPGTLVIFWDVNAPATLDRITSNAADPMRSRIPRYDLILTYCGGDSIVKRYIAFGARQCVPIYNALDPHTHHPAAPDSKFAGDLGFLGNRLPDREARVDEFFFRAAKLCPHRKFVLGGCGWEDKPMPPNVRWVGHVYTRDHNAFNSSARAVLNVSRQGMATHGYSPTSRVFEAAGAGACIISDAWDGIEMFFEPGAELLVAHNAEEVAQHLETLTPRRAGVIGAAALRRVLRHHTYAQRVRQLEQLLGAERQAWYSHAIHPPEDASITMQRPGPPN